MEDLIDNAYMLFQFNEDRPPAQAQTPQRPPQPQLPPQGPSQTAPPPPLQQPLPAQQPSQSPVSLLPPSVTKAPATAPYPTDHAQSKAFGMQPIQAAAPIDGPRSAPLASREQDFTPELPPRPSLQNSIHPSARMSSAPMSPPPGARAKERPGSMPPPRREDTVPVQPAQAIDQSPPFDPEATLRSRPPSTLRGVSDVTVDEQYASDAITAMSFSQHEVEVASVHSRPISRQSSRS